MRKLTLLCSVFFIVSCVNHRQDNKDAGGSIINIKSEYPDEVVKQNLQTQFDKAKWYMYCIHCDDSCLFTKSAGVNDKITFASLDLKLENIQHFNDTTELRLNFYLDTIKCDTRILNNLKMTIGAAYQNSSDSILYFLSPFTGSRFLEEGARSRYQNPLQPNVIRYIQNNTSKLHPWFLNEAKKRGVL